MRCELARRQLAVFRELDDTARAAVQQHVGACVDCRRALEAYERMDDVLLGLRAIAPSAGLQDAVMRRTTHSAPRRQPASSRPERSLPRRSLRWVYSLAAVALALVVTLTGTLRASAESLPGDALYPVKRAAEQVRLTLTFDPQERGSLLEQFNDMRVSETRQVLLLQRDVQVEFHGRVEAVVDEGVIVNGLLVSLADSGAQGAPPTVGSVVVVRAQAQAGQLQAQSVLAQEPTPTIPAASDRRPSRTTAATRTPVAGATPTQATTRQSPRDPSATSSMSQPTAVPTEPSEQVQRPSLTPPREDKPTRIGTGVLMPLETPREVGTPDVDRTPSAAETAAPRPTPDVGASVVPMPTRQPWPTPDATGLVVRPTATPDEPSEVTPTPAEEPSSVPTMPTAFWTPRPVPTLPWATPPRLATPTPLPTRWWPRLTATARAYPEPTRLPTRVPTSLPTKLVPRPTPTARPDAEATKQPEPTSKPRPWPTLTAVSVRPSPTAPAADQPIPAPTRVWTPRPWATMPPMATAHPAPNPTSSTTDVEPTATPQPLRLATIATWIAGTRVPPSASNSRAAP